MRVFVTGGTGMIGRHLVARLVGRGDTPVLLTRRPDEARRNPAWRGLKVVGGDPAQPGPWRDEVDGCDAVVNLAGANVFDGRWNAERKAKIRDSRVHAADQLVAAIGRATHRPRVFVQGSAIGYYGAEGDEPATEASPSGPDFLAVVCRELEDAARPAEALGCRLPIVRTGVVLEQGQGSLKVMAPIFRWLPGGAAPVGGGPGGGLLGLGRGQQWMSWIHIDDIVGLFLLALDDDQARGPINGTAPHPVRNVDFSRALAKVLRRPFLKVGPPDVVLRVLFGEVADVITKGRSVLPARAEALGYRFRFPDLDGALHDIFRRRRDRDPEPRPVARPAATGAHH